MKHFIGIRFSRYGQVRIGCFENIREEFFSYGDAVVIQNDNMLSLGNVVWQSDHLSSLCASHQQISHERNAEDTFLSQQNTLEQIENNAHATCCAQKNAYSEGTTCKSKNNTIAQVNVENFTKNVIRTKGPFAESFEATQVQQYSMVRLATEEEKRIQENNKTFCIQAHKFCKKCVRERELDMKLVDVESLLDRSKIIFYFTAPTRIDFRELVKDLVREYRTRIELRQISVRHETQMLGTLGNCGMAVCCRRYLKEFVPVTIKMAKEQNLFLNPTKISGMCGRLLCCLSYEQEGYEAFHRVAPKVGKIYQTDRGILRVIRTDMFHNIVIIQKNDEPEESIPLDTWKTLKPKIFDNQQILQANNLTLAHDKVSNTAYEPTDESYHGKPSSTSYDNYTKMSYDFPDIVDEYMEDFLDDNLELSHNASKQSLASSTDQIKRKHKLHTKTQPKQRLHQQMRPREKAQKRPSFDDEN